MPTRRLVMLREVAAGPVGVVFAAEEAHVDGGRLVAVKVLRAPAVADVGLLRRARDDGRRLRSAASPNAIGPHDVALVDGWPALVSPWIDGIDLVEWLEVLRKQNTALPGRVALDVLRKAAGALDAAQNRLAWREDRPLAMAHRDLKPSNLLVDRNGDLRVVDFGCGAAALAAASELASTLLRAGLVRYQSPGRRAGRRGGAPSDVYGLGVLGIELFKGSWLRRPRNENPGHDRHLAEVVAGLGDTGMRSVADDGALRALLLRMVAWDPSSRPTAGEVATTLRVLADRAPGPCLETFTHSHALPWFKTIPDGEALDLEAEIVELPDDDGGWPDSLPRETPPPTAVRAALALEGPAAEVPVQTPTAPFEQPASDDGSWEPSPAPGDSGVPSSVVGTASGASPVVGTASGASSVVGTASGASSVVGIDDTTAAPVDAGESRFAPPAGPPREVAGQAAPLPDPRVAAAVLLLGGGLVTAAALLNRLVT